MKILLIAVLAATIFACSYRDIADADYPSQKVYMPSAMENIYLVNDTNPTTGTFRYELNLSNNKLIIPLGVYRSGINKKGSVAVNISINNDTINKLIASGELTDKNGKNIELIPQQAYTIPSSVSISDGKEVAKINVEIDLDYIAQQADERLALAISIESSQVETDKDKCLTVLELNTNFLVPVAKFDFTVDKQNDRKFTFTNLTAYASSCTWDFGDGTVITSNESKMVHEFSDFNTYNVKLTVTGISGKPMVYSVTFHVWENISSLYIKNPGNPFLRSDINRTQVVGNLAEWIATDDIKTLSNGVLYGGFLRDYKSNDVVHNGLMDIYSKTALNDAMVYQTTTLPAGNYRITFTLLDFLGANSCYFAVAQGISMPNSAQMEDSNIIGVQFFDSMLTSEQELFFSLASEQTVTIGFVVNTQAPPAGIYNEVIIKSVGLYK